MEFWFLCVFNIFPCKLMTIRTLICGNFVRFLRLMFSPKRILVFLFWGVCLFVCLFAGDLGVLLIRIYFKFSAGGFWTKQEVGIWILVSPEGWLRKAVIPTSILSQSQDQHFSCMPFWKTDTLQVYPFTEDVVCRGSRSPFLPGQVLGSMSCLMCIY